MEKALIAIRNERIKLFANSLDRASTACVAVGFFGPMVAQNAQAAASIIGLLFWISAAIILHLLASAALGGLQ